MSRNMQANAYIACYIHDVQDWRCLSFSARPGKIFVAFPVIWPFSPSGVPLTDIVGLAGKNLLYYGRR
jgi:hypothetical protein